MKKHILQYMALMVALIATIFILGHKTPDNGKFYYAFQEKIYLEPIPGVYLVKVKDRQQADNLRSAIDKSIAAATPKTQYRNDYSFTIDLNGTGKSIETLTQDKQPDILLIRPAYRYGRQEMYYADEILVEPDDGVAITDVLAKTGLRASVTVKENKHYAVLQVAPSLDACDVANTIQESGLVKYSHPNFMMPIEKHQLIPNDTYFANQFYLRNTGQVFNPAENHSGTANADINAAFAWNTTLGNNAIIVAVIDEGVTPDHPDLPNARQVRLNGSNFVPGENANNPSPGLHGNHGNACAGIIAATRNNNQGITGIAPNIRIMPIKIMGDNAAADVNGVAAAIDFAWQNGAHVISNSWGYATANPNATPAIVNAINRAVTQGRGGRGSVVAFSASNSARRTIGMQGQVRFPSNVQINGVLTVGASDRNDLQSDYSPMSNAGGPNNQIIDIVAPSHRAYPPQAYTDGLGGGIAGEGFEVWSIDIPNLNGYNRWNNAAFPVVHPAFGEILPAAGVNNLSYTGRMGGTSASCPQVAAVAALILSLNNNITQQQVFNILTQSADRVGGYTYNGNGWSAELGNGRLNACAALSRVPGRFSISGTDYLCSTSTYTIPGLPAGSVINWSSSNNAIASISPAGVATRTGHGVVTFTATIVSIPNRCGGQITLTKTGIIAGTPTPSGISGPGQDICYTRDERGWGEFFVVWPLSQLTYQWQINGMNAGWGTSLWVESVHVGVGTHQIRVRSHSAACGYSPWYTSTFIVINCGGPRAKIFPNPASSTLTVSLEQDEKAKVPVSIQEIELVDKVGMIRLRQKAGKGISSLSIPVSHLPADVYTLRIFDGTAWYAHKVSIQH